MTQYTNDWLRKKIASDPDDDPAAGGLPEPRFFLDHGVIHDRATGRHIAAEFEDDWQLRLLTLLNELTNALDARDRELAGARLNERRYLWLREQQYNEDVDLRFMDHNEDGPTSVWYSCWNDELDAAIDAALAQGDTREGTI